MIMTVTLNPSVDINYEFTTPIKIDDVNRVADVRKTAGGKGLNVSRVLRQLQEEVTATGFLGGDLGEFIAKRVKNLKIEDAFVRIEGNTRNCIAIMHEGNQTEILEKGPSIQDEEKKQFNDTFVKNLKNASIVTISGSLPAEMEEDYYNELLTLSHRSDVPVLLDTKSNLLERAISHKEKPFLIKPNFSELQELTNMKFKNKEDIAEMIHSYLFAEIPWVVVTLGGDGAVVKCRNKVFSITNPSVKVLNPVGSGDSVIAGFASAFYRGMDSEKAIRYALAMGVSNAATPSTADIREEKVEEYMKEFQINLLYEKKSK